MQGDGIVTNKDSNKKRVGWFKPFNSMQNQMEQDNVDQSVDMTKTMNEEQLNTMITSDDGDIQNDSVLLLRDNQDKVVSDLIVSLENMIKDRQLIIYKSKDTDDQLFAANEIINRIKQDLRTQEHLLLEKNKEVQVLESNLSNKQMTYDQLLEDYKEYQNISNTDYEKISIQLDTEINKYNKLSDELINSQRQSMSRINTLEEKIRNLEIENNQYKQQYQKVLDEKSELMKTINDFTDRMSFSLSTKTPTNPSDPE